MPLSQSIRYWGKEGSGRKSGKVERFMSTSLCRPQRLRLFVVRIKKPLKAFEQSPDSKFLQNSGLNSL